MKTMYGFEMRRFGSRGWSASACGQQDRSNYFDTEDAAIKELPNLARVLEVPIDDLRVVPVEVKERVWKTGAVHEAFGVEGSREYVGSERGARTAARAIAKRAGYGWRPTVTEVQS